MADNKACGCNFPVNSRFKEAVCVDTNRVYDSCCDKDCLSDLRVHFTDSAQRLIDSATAVKGRKAEIINACVDVEPVPFNRGCFSVDITYFFKIVLDVFCKLNCETVKVCGLATFTKKCILFGSEGKVKVFSSEMSMDEMDHQLPKKKTAPRAKVQVVEPIILDVQLCKPCECCECVCSCKVPHGVEKCFEGTFCQPSEDVAVKATLGLFSIVQLERDVQMLIPAFDFCIPQKECCFDEKDPCDSFKKICFPTDEFFPPTQGC